MNSAHFNNKLLPMIIEPVIKNVYQNMDNTFIQNTRLINKHEKFHDSYVEKLCEIYEQKRDWLRDIYWGTQSKAFKDDYVDMHKIAAVLCRALVIVKPFQFDLVKAEQEKENHCCSDQPLTSAALEWLVNNFLCNYKVAVDVALLITLYDFVDRLYDSYSNLQKSDIDETTKKYYKSILETLNEKCRLDCYDDPVLEQNHASFYHSLIYDIAMNDINNRNFDYLGFANICFQLQQYNILKIMYARCGKNKE